MLSTIWDLFTSGAMSVFSGRQHFEVMSLQMVTNGKSSTADTRIMILVPHIACLA